VDKTSDGSNLGGDCDFWITMAFPLSELKLRGINMRAARLVWAGSSAQAQNLSGDIVCDNQTTSKLSNASADPLSFCVGGCGPTHSDGPSGLANPTTTLSAGMAAGDNTATVVSTAGYPSSGVVVIGNEDIQYTGTTATTFTGLTRGAFSTTAASHSSGA